jgi:DNA mismatch repair protein MutS2
VIYPSSFESKIGFDQLRQMLKEECLCPLGKKKVDAIRFSSRFDLLQKLLSQTEDFRQLLLFESLFPSDDYYDPADELSKIAIEGSFIETQPLLKLKRALMTITDIIRFFNKKKEENKYPFLQELTDKVQLDKAIIKSIDSIIDDKGNIKDNASDELLQIRRELLAKQSTVVRKINAILQSARKDGIVDDQAELTIRGGRLVIPVSSAYKRRIKGFIHDESATGQTVFIEPEAIFEMNNQIRELENAEKREIVKILIRLTDLLRSFLPELKECFNYLGLIDFIRAKAKLAIRIEAARPVLNNYPCIQWQKAKHPLLFLSHKAQKKTVEVLNIALDETKRILVISGPNAGGKSVCLKTTGLVQYMLQCGLLVPMTEYSEAGIFERIFIDIGDQQSIEDDLSTYSSHLLNMKHFVANANNSTLFLIDEFGSGTEPQLGGAIAEVVLEELNDKKAFGVVTTHYANIKLLADKTNGIINGAMLFDYERMQPLYKLDTGKAGSSFAFEIAAKIGFREDLLKKARDKAGLKMFNYDKQLQEVEMQKAELERKLAGMSAADDILAELTEKYQQLTNELEINRKSIINTARIEAKQLLEETNRQIENTIRQIREDQADKEKTKLLRKDLKQFNEKITVEKALPKLPSKKERKEKKTAIKSGPELEVLHSAISVADYVRIAGQNQVGEVQSIKENQVTVLFGYVKAKIPLSQLEKFKKPKQKATASNLKRNLLDMNEKFKKFKTSLDLRGKKAEEALTVIAQYIDDAILLDTHEVHILHGKGDGILRTVVRDHLKNIKEVKAYTDGHPDREGAGVTIVTFK